MDSAKAANAGRRRPGAPSRESILVGELRLPASDAAPSIARRWLIDQLGPTGLFGGAWHQGGQLFDVLVCTSELVNVSPMANSTTMGARLHLHGTTVRVSLLDDGSGTVADSKGERGHAQALALRIFNTVADEWGIEPAPGGRTLWFEFSVD